MLKKNEYMTDHVNITLPHFANNTRNSNIQVGKVLVGPNDSVKNLGVMFDGHLRMKDHINTICECSYYHLQNIRYLESFYRQQLWKLHPCRHHI